MTEKVIKTKYVHRGMIPLALIGVLSSSVFVFNAIAAGIVPAEVIMLANNARTKMGLMPLSENAKLSEAAKNKANDMIKNDYFAHTSPKGVDPWYWIKQSGYQYKAAGENLAINYTTAREEHAAWMKSETHRANILNARYQEIGVAVASGTIDGKESIVTVEYFGTPFVAVADQIAPVPVATVPVPAVEGVATAIGVPMENKALQEVGVMPEENQAIPVAPSRGMFHVDTVWFLFAAAAVLSLSLLAMPLVFITRAYRFLWPALHALVTKTPSLDTNPSGNIHSALAR